jgi:hypothetical protein
VVAHVQQRQHFKLNEIWGRIRSLLKGWTQWTRSYNLGKHPDGITLSSGHAQCPIWGNPEDISGGKKGTRRTLAVERRGDPEDISGVSDTNHEFFTQNGNVLVLGAGKKGRGGKGGIKEEGAQTSHEDDDSQHDGEGVLTRTRLLDSF